MVLVDDGIAHAVERSDEEVMDDGQGQCAVAAIDRTDVNEPVERVENRPPGPAAIEARAASRWPWPEPRGRQVSSPHDARCPSCLNAASSGWVST